MDKAYYPTTWENRPSTASPLDEINLNSLSSGVSVIDDRVIALDQVVGNSVRSVSVDESTGQMIVTLNNKHSYTYNPVSKVYDTINANQQAAQHSFEDIAVNFRSVDQMLSDMDLKIDITAEGANQGITNLQTLITQNDGYYRQEMSGIKTDVSNLAAYTDGLDQATNQRITTVSSSITQTTDAIQLQVTQLSQSVDGDVDRLQSQINQTAGSIALKVSKLEVIDDLQQEFGSGIEITPDCITFASTGSMVVNTNNFKLDEEGNAEFKGHVAMDSGSVGGVPIIPSPGDFDSTLSVQHSHHSWKLRSAAMGENDERYYTYMTAGKHLVVTNTESGSVSSSNNVSGNCAIGSPNYPWKAGYFKNLRACTTEDGKIVRHNVIPEGMRITLYASDWSRVSDFGDDVWVFRQSIGISNLKPGKTFASIAVDNAISMIQVYKWSLEAACIVNGTVTFFARNTLDPTSTLPPGDISFILLLEDYIKTGTPEGPVIDGSYDEESNTLTLMWDSMDDSSKFINIIGDQVIIEKYDESIDDWVEVLTAPDSGLYNTGQFADDKLIIGEEVK